MLGCDDGAAMPVVVLGARSGDPEDVTGWTPPPDLPGELLLSLEIRTPLIGAIGPEPVVPALELVGVPQASLGVEPPEVRGLGLDPELPLREPEALASHSFARPSLLGGTVDVLEISAPNADPPLLLRDRESGLLEPNPAPRVVCCSNRINTSSSSSIALPSLELLLLLPLLLPLAL